MAFLTITLLAAACGESEPDLTRQEVREIVRSEMPTPAQPGLTRAEVQEAIRTALAEMPQPQAGPSMADVEGAMAAAMERISQGQVTRSEVEEAVQVALGAIPQPGVSESRVEDLIRKAIAGLPEPEPGLSAAEAQRIADYTVAAIPPKTAPAQYTKFFVNNAITRYRTLGLEATVAHYNQARSIDGQWYIFILDRDGTVISHFNAHLLGANLDGPLGTDVEGYEFGPEMLSATEEGMWVSYVYNNPETRDTSPEHLGEVQLKHAWVVRYDDLIFGSGWYTTADEYTKLFVQQAIDRYHKGGLESTLEHYNSTESLFREWFAFIAGRDGNIIAHYDPTVLGRPLDHVLETAGFVAEEEGSWVTLEEANPDTGRVEEKHAWVISHDGLVFGSGWYHE